MSPSISTSSSPFPPLMQPRRFAVMRSHQPANRHLQFNADNLAVSAKIPSSLMQVDSQVEDHFSDPQNSLSPRRFIGLFSAGLGASLAGRVGWQTLKKLIAKGTPPKVVQEKLTSAKILEGTKGQEIELNVAQSFSDPLSSIYNLVMYDPAQRAALAGYSAYGALGYLAGSVFQGLQETWVRREETKIRARLIERIPEAFQGSVKIKQDFDTDLKTRAQGEIYNLLVARGIENAHDLVSDVPVIEPKEINQRYFYEPTHRQVTPVEDVPVKASPFAASQPSITPLRFKGLDTLSDKLESATSSSRLDAMQLLDAGVVGAGVLVGLAAQSFANLFAVKDKLLDVQGKSVIYKTIHVKDKEGWWLFATKSRRNAVVAGGFMALAATAKLGQLVVDGLRQVQVTKMNANTELLYQRHNWLSLDPQFHAIAEEEAYKHHLKELDRDLSYLKNDPTRLQQRIQTMLANIGRNSAPKYFPMTPPVGLVDARS